MSKISDLEEYYNNLQIINKKQTIIENFESVIFLFFGFTLIPVIPIIIWFFYLKSRISIIILGLDIGFFVTWAAIFILAILMLRIEDKIESKYLPKRNSYFEEIFQHAFNSYIYLKKYVDTDNGYFKKLALQNLKSLSSISAERYFSIGNVYIGHHYPWIELTEKSKKFIAFFKIINGKIIPRIEKEIELKNITDILLKLSYFFYFYTPIIKKKYTDDEKTILKNQIENNLLETYEVIKNYEDIPAESEKPKEKLLAKIHIMASSLIKCQSPLICFLSWFFIVLLLSSFPVFILLKYSDLTLKDIGVVYLMIILMGPITLTAASLNLKKSEK